jgi:mannose-6-phosphate isomerase-like protein (cupin superfamily)
MPRPEPVSISKALSELEFFGGRTATTIPDESAGAFAEVAAFREGGVYVGYWAGESEWERHPVADEIVMVVEGETTIFFRNEDGEESARLGPGDLIIVPRATWHRFETPEAVKLLSITPQPSDHRATWDGAG